MNYIPTLHLLWYILHQITSYAKKVTVVQCISQYCMLTNQISYYVSVFNVCHSFEWNIRNVNPQIGSSTTTLTWNVTMNICFVVIFHLTVFSTATKLHYGLKNTKNFIPILAKTRVIYIYYVNEVISNYETILVVIKQHIFHYKSVAWYISVFKLKHIPINMSVYEHVQSRL